MSRISPAALVRAVVKVRALDLIDKEGLVDELLRAQPHAFASFLVQQQLAVSAAKTAIQDRYLAGLSEG